MFREGGRGAWPGWPACGQRMATSHGMDAGTPMCMLLCSLSPAGVAGRLFKQGAPILCLLVVGSGPVL